ncbi:hypothetical protein [Sulfitobacter sp. R18_1]|uniref:hypothetical protein n=1 Tax=Sulfitobacter sp. R18_1 TaxID=2821104 RepID=UPI001ADC8556|nr:hypothetical protein [Sulfitobacter sp. R18_1]MBO9428715.1 hypothetical protein [Sulfitobacter sp. R18_1]
MGIGHYHDSRGVTIHFEPFEELDSEDIDGREFAWDNALEDIAESLPDDFTWTGFNQRSRSHAIAHSELHDLEIREDEGGYGYVYLTIKPRNFEGTCDYILQEEREEKAEATTEAEAERVFTAIYEAGLLGNLYKGTSYTSATWQPEASTSTPKM